MYPFDPTAIEKHGWRQGAVLGQGLLQAARDHAPTGIRVDDGDWLIVTSHDCDLVNGSLDKEPFVEVLRAVIIKGEAPHRQQAWGRNPRVIQFSVVEGSTPTVLRCKVHERWPIPRELLVSEPPPRFLDTKTRRLLAEWLAKRYIRSAFPTQFDRRWRGKLHGWTDLLERNSAWIQGVYLRLSTLSELDPATPYKCHLIIAAPDSAKTRSEWNDKREQLEDEVTAFWGQFTLSIECAGVEVLTTAELTLAEIELYQRFDADWVSFDDDSERIPLEAGFSK